MSIQIETVRTVDVPTSIVHGPGAIERLGELVRGLGVEHPFLVTDGGVVSAGLLDEAQRHLEGATGSTACTRTRTSS
jgi:choline dehydrogenase